jgi:hypothetical protein
MMLNFGFLFCILLLCINCIQVVGIKADRSLSTSIPRGIAVALTFGMVQGAKITIDYDVKYDHSDVIVPHSLMIEKNLQMQLLVVNEIQRTTFYNGIGTSQPNTTAINACISPVMFRKELHTKGSFTHIIGSNEPDAEQYTILIMQCRTSYDGTIVNATVHASMENPLAYSTEMSHLPVNEMPHLVVSQGLMIANSSLVIALIGQMWSNRELLSGIHYMFLCTLILQIIDLIVDYYYYMDAASTGVSDVWFNAASNIIDYFAESFLLLTFLLLCMGWSTLRFRLSNKQMMRVLGGVGIFFVFGLGSSFCFDTESSVCQGVYLITHVIRALILLAVIICLNFTITQLRSMLAQGPWDPSTPYYYARARQFSTFRVVFVLYLLLPTGFLLVQDIMYTWKQSWVNFMLLELRNIFLFLVTGTAFAPFQDAFLTRAFDGTFSNGPGQPPEVERPHED